MKIRNAAAVIVILAMITGTALKASAQANPMIKKSVLLPADDQTAHEMHEAEAVSKRHEAELKKIPHVRSVTAEVDAQKEIAILVQVDDPKNIDEVTNKLPSQIEGFPVDVDAAFVAQAGEASVDLGEGFSVENGFESRAKPASKSAAKPDGSD